MPEFDIIGAGFVPGIPGIFGNNRITHTGEVVVPGVQDVSPEADVPTQPTPEQPQPDVVEAAPQPPYVPSSNGG